MQAERDQKYVLDLKNSAQRYVAVWMAGWEGSLGKMDTCIRMAESLCCSPETIHSVVICYIPMQNKNFFFFNKYNNNNSN